MISTEKQSLFPKIRVKELTKIDLEGGYLIDGFPSMGFSSAIATESMIHTSQFELAGIIDSESFPPISIVKDEKPNFPTRVFVNKELKVAVFLSYLTIDQPLQRIAAKTMLNWAKKHKIRLIVSSVAVKSTNGEVETIGIGSTDAARTKIKEAGLKVLKNGTVPGIPGMLLNEGMVSNQDVIVIIFHSEGIGPDFKSSADLCMSMSKLIPGASCDVSSLQKEAEKAEVLIKEAQIESRGFKDAMYQ